MFFKLRKNKIIDNRGGALIFALIFGTISFSLVVMGISGYALYQNKLAMSKHAREMAFQIADAGVAYYRWHIFANENDYQDGTATTGPYIHDYFDKNKNNIGKFSLDLTAPRTGSTVSTIKSTGWLNAYSGAKRTIKARVGKPSLTDYSFLTNSEIWIGPGEVVHGRMHSNGAVRFDGETDSLVSSQLLGYYCPPSQASCPSRKKGPEEAKERAPASRQKRRALRRTRRWPRRWCNPARVPYGVKRGIPPRTARQDPPSPSGSRASAVRPRTHRARIPA